MNEFPMKVLIVEDNEPMRRMIHNLIAPLAEEIFECGDGGQAIEIYSRFRPDWVLMDIDLPHVDGLTAVREIIAEYPKAKIVMVTNFDEKDMRQAARAAGASEFILKEDLLAVRSFLKNKLTNQEIKK